MAADAAAHQVERQDVDPSLRERPGEEQQPAVVAALDWADKGALRVYLVSLRRPSRVIVP